MAERYNNKISIYLNTEQKQLIDKIAVQEGFTESSFIRKVVLDYIQKGYSKTKIADEMANEIERFFRRFKQE